MEIFKLVGSVLVDTAEAESSLQKTADEAENTGNKLADGVKTAGKWAAGVATAAVAVGSAMVSAAKDTASELDVIDKASIRMGVSAESYQELAYAAGLCGVEMTTMEKAAKKLEGTDLNMEDALDQLMAIGDEGERTQAAIELFGESVAYQLTPLLESGAEGLESMKQEANDLGLVMSQDAVSAGAAMNDQFSKIEESLSTLKNGLVSEFMPYVAEILQWVIDNIPMIKETVSSVMDAVLPIVEPILDTIMEMLPPLLKAIKGLIDWLMPYIKPVLNSIKSLFSSFSSLMTGDVKGFVNGIIKFLSGIVSTFLNLGKGIFNALWEGLVSVWNSIANWVSDKVSWLVDKIAFWRSGSDSMNSNSHAGGLSYVPYDNYPALLHRGESVMTAADSQSLLEAVKTIASNGGDSSPISITVQSVLDGRIIGENVTNYQRKRARAFG